VKDTVLISTHHLPTAGALRGAFKSSGYRVELVTPREELDPGAGVLLVLTDALARTAGDLATQARDRLHIPVFGVAAPGRERELAALGLAETFAPSADPDEVLLIAHTLLERRRLQRLTGIVGETDAIREALERVVQIAPVDSTVLITGESGTGKELFARGVHGLSPRRHKAFIAVNVAALSPTVLESELFGHEKGAFTGAIDSRRGLFELAHQGTIFLDEIGEIPPAIQTKLLRVLEQKEFLRVGGEAPIRVDARVIAATNQDLRQEVAAGRFRRDLYYRINVLHIELPPLRDRQADIPRLVEAFVEEVSARNGRRFAGISADAMRILCEYAWPGNVRELRNLVESMVVLSPGREIGPDDIPEQVRSPGSSPLLPVPMPGPGSGEGETAQLRPQLEFVFRTLVDLRVDMDDLRREFEAYRQEHRFDEALLPEETGRVEIVSTRADLPRTALERPPPAEPGQAAEAAPLPSPDDVPGRDEAAVRMADEAPRDASSADQPPVGASAADQPPEGTGFSEELPASPPATAEDAPETVQPPPAPEPPPGSIVLQPGMTLEDIEREAILAALEEVDGSRRHAARLLGIAERTLYRKIRRYGLE
jgi:DNA-binding NtrC family response regulator